MTPPEPNALSLTDSPRPTLECRTQAQLRDHQLDLLQIVPVTFVYDIATPHALCLRIRDTARREWIDWYAAREVFLAPVLWGFPLGLMDVTANTIELEKAHPGLRLRRVPTLRVMLRSSFGEDMLEIGPAIYLDIEIETIREYFEHLLAVVPMGSEAQHLDIDGALARLFAGGGS